MRSVLGNALSIDQAKYYLRKAEYDVETAIQECLEAKFAAPPASKRSRGRPKRKRSNPPRLLDQCEAASADFGVGDGGMGSESKGKKGRRGARKGGRKKDWGNIVTVKLDNDTGKEVRSWMESEFDGCMEEKVDGGGGRTVRFRVWESVRKIQEKVADQKCFFFLSTGIVSSSCPLDNNILSCTCYMK
eukprot:1168933-Amorphochlora_amoeboformis.AAC.1